jgi:hypothetical protein
MNLHLFVEHSYDVSVIVVAVLIVCLFIQGC